jgi:hypothetical protein
LDIEADKSSDLGLTGSDMELVIGEAGAIDLDFMGRSPNPFVSGK